ncbi:hypothetical protein LCGC14_0404140 [marine sediment metagenome]|uniref:Uncharacterized protein n=1 Tax=marine sediment metagenome TaxID=412755 RepID=A0A0F9SVY1_9ZZZZ
MKHRYPIGTKIKFTFHNSDKGKIEHKTTTKGKCFNYGEKHGMAKLTENSVKVIIRKYQTGLFTQKEIAKVYGVTDVTISKIVNNKLWKHIWR